MQVNFDRSFSSLSQENITVSDIELIIKKNFGKKSVINLIETAKYGDINSCYVIEIKNPEKKLFLKVENDNIIPKFYYGQIEREHASNELMKKHGIPCPFVYRCDTEKTDIAKKYILTEFVDGQLLYDIWNNLTIEEKKQSKDEIIALIDKFESITSNCYGDIYRGGNKGEFSNYAEAFKNLAEILVSDYTDFALLDNNDLLIINTAIEKATLNLTNNFKPCFIHMDIHSRNLFAEKTDSGVKITAVLDFGNAMFGLPTTDEYRARTYKIFKEDNTYISHPKNSFILNVHEQFSVEILYSLECLLFEGMMKKSYGGRQNLLTRCEAYLK